MTIRWIDGADILDRGGYIDTQTGRCIVPEWFSNLSPDNFSGFSTNDYIRFERESQRYIKAPVVRSTYLCAVSAMNLGISREQLLMFGMKNAEYWQTFYPKRDNDNIEWRYQPTDEEYSICTTIENCMKSHNLYYEYICEKVNVMNSIATEWFSKIGITLDED